MMRYSADKLVKSVIMALSFSGKSWCIYQKAQDKIT